MITDRLDKCPFCQTAMVKQARGEVSIQLVCPQQKTHKSMYLWAWYLTDPSKMDAVNVCYSGFQMCWHLTYSEFRVFKQTVSLDKEVILELPYLPDFPLDQETIASKIKTMIVFS